MMSRDVTRWHRMHSGEQTMKDTSIEFPSPFFGPLKLHIVKIWPVIWSLVFEDVGPAIYIILTL